MSDAEISGFKSSNRVQFVERRDLVHKIDLLLAKMKVSSNSSFISDRTLDVKTCLKSLDKIDKLILGNLIQNELLDEYYVSVSDEFCVYKVNVEEQLCNINCKADGSIVANVASMSVATDESMFGRPNPVRPPSESGSCVSSNRNDPPLSIGRFEGDEEDKLAFSRFHSRFMAVIGNNSAYSDERKLLHLHACLGDIAMQLIRHLSVSASNYLVALNILKDEYLNIDFLLERIFKRIVDIPSPPENDLKALKLFIHELQALLYDLKSYRVNFFEPDTPGFRFVSSVITNKLPTKFREVLIDKVSSNYPSILQLFEHYQTLIRRLEVTAKPAKVEIENKNQFNCNDKIKDNIATLENFETVSKHYASAKPVNHKPVRPCKFCSLAIHSMNKCDQYPDIKSRLARCLQLRICELCTSSKHESADCPGKEAKLDFECNYCKKKTHIAALCEEGHLSNLDPDSDV